MVIYRMECLVILLIGLLTTIEGLNNGLARTPPMGWLSWERYRCNVNCKDYPDTCISENLYKRMADLMVSEGYKEAGYEYVNIDDCWMAKQRDKFGRLQPDPERFPSGIKALAQYMHDRGLKLGIYEDFGTRTCGGYPGSEFYMMSDAKSFAEWKIDMLKFDGCFSDPKQMDAGYKAMQIFLNNTGHPMVYSCEWPLYQVVNKIKPNYTAVRENCNIWRVARDVQDSWVNVQHIIDVYGTDDSGFQKYTGPGGFADADMPNYAAIRETCNLWRNYKDVTDSWQSVLGIVEFYGTDDGNFSAYNGPGGWNDPDMLVVGDFGLSSNEQKTQFILWAMWSAPLFMSNDLQHISNTSKQLLQHRGIIAINQDPLGAQARRLWRISSIGLWLKPLAQNGSYAIALVNRGNEGTPQILTLQVKQLGLPGPAYNLTDIYNNKYIGHYKSMDSIKFSIDPLDVFFAKATPTIS